MFIPAHKVHGFLNAGIDAMGTSLLLDVTAYNAVASAIAPSNHTYLMLDGGPGNVEVIKVLSAANGIIVVERAKDGTDAKAFAFGTTVKYVLAADAVRDMITEAPSLNVTLTGANAVTVTEVGPNNYTIDAPIVELTSVNGSVGITGNAANGFDLSMNMLQLGCCDTGSGDGPLL